MSDLNTPPNHPTEPPVSRRWKIWEAALAGIAILALAGWATTEWQSYSGHEATFKDLEQDLRARRPIALSDLPSRIHGLAFRKEETRADSFRQITLRWPSVMQDLQIPLFAQGDQIIAMDESGLELALSNTRPASPIKGLPKGYEQVVALKMIVDPNVKSEMRGTLGRELIRQAILIAAEDELGLPTLDTSMGESVPEGEGLGPFSVYESTSPGFTTNPGELFGNQTHKIVRVSGYRTGVRVEKPPAVQPIKIPLSDWIDPLIEELEVQSRGLYVEMLQVYGYQKAVKSSTKNVAVAAPEDHLDLVSQFAVIRHVRSQIRESGQTPERLGELVRAYANLGNLIDFHWSLASKACKARSLLYAQRLVAKTGPTPFSLAHRAYAQSLAGFHSKAIQTVEAVRTASGEAAPDWFDLIDAHCNFKLEVLDDAEGPHQELAWYLRTRMVEPEQDPERSLQVISRFVNLNHACLRIAETLTETSSFGIRGAATQSIVADTWDGIYQRLEETPGMPSSVMNVLLENGGNSRRHDLAGEIARRLTVITKLEQAEQIKKQPGPSWRVVGQMLRDASVVQLWHQLRFTTMSLAADGDDLLRAYRPLIDGHRDEKFLNGFGRDQRQAVTSLKEYFDNIKPESLDFTMVLVFDDASKFGQTEHFRLMDMITTKSDDIYEDYLRKQNLMYFANSHDLIEVSPKWTLSISEAAQFKSDPPVKEWEEQYASSPAVMYGLYWYYLQRQQRPQAIRCIEKLLVVAPSSEYYRLLAGLYKAENNFEMWRASLGKALQMPDLGLDHARVHEEMAEYHRQRGEWQEAKPHAVAAAESGSQWGLMMAARVFEGLAEWRQAEAYVREASQRYTSSSHHWYFWCVRTGHGNRDDARLLAMRYWNSNEFKSLPNEMWQLAIGKVLDGDIASGHAVLLEMQSRRRELAAVLFAAVLADDAGQLKVRDDLLRKIPTMGVDDWVAFEMTDLFLGMLNEKGPKRWNTQRFEHAVVFANTKSVPFLYLMAARFLASHGEPELSLEYLRCVATIADVQHPAAALAAEMLRKQKIFVGVPRKHDLPDSLVPAMVRLTEFSKIRNAGQLDDADIQATKAIATRPDLACLLLIRGDLRASRGQYAEARADFESAIQLDPDSFQAHEKLAWMLATCDDTECRDGKLSLEQATTAAKLRQFETMMSVATLAAANAECGDFDRAIELETHARTLSGFKLTGLDRLKEYQAKRALRIKPELKGKAK